VVLALLMAVLQPPGALHAARAPGEYEVKAALLFNFAKFVTWPAASFPSPDAPFAIGVVGDDPFGPALENVLAGKVVGGRPIVIRRWRTIADAGECQILFIAASERTRWRRIFDILAQQPVLTVSDGPDFAPQGGMIGLTVVDGHLRFDINPVGATRAHLEVSSRLLSLAHVVPAPR
jgi:hypothetical protein